MELSEGWDANNADGRSENGGAAPWVPSAGADNDKHIGKTSAPEKLDNFAGITSKLTLMHYDRRKLPITTRKP
jgi:hypothetical protein